MVLNLLIIILFFANVSSSMTVNYVKPLTSEKASSCFNVQRPCLTLNEYARGSDEYFINNTRFYFYPGIHRLNYTLNLMNLQNFSFLGWPHGDQVVTIAIDSSASITWNESWNIKIFSIKFALNGNFTFIMRFKRSQLVQLTNISIYGNWYSGCSSIISEKSALEFKHSTLIGINGLIGAALMMIASNITFRGSIVFADNTGTFGGSIYLYYGTLILNGTSLFRNNTSNQTAMNRKMLHYACVNNNSIYNITLWRELQPSLLESGCGGAIVCDNSYLEINYHSNFTYNIAGLHGGAMVLSTCVLIIQGNVSFVENEASNYGGAMVIQSSSSYINGNLFLNKNKAFWGGAIAIIEGNFTIKGYTLFDSNSAKESGGALYIDWHVNFIYCGSIYSGSNSTSFDTDVLPLNNIKAFDAECSTDNASSFNNSITFLRNTARNRGGSITCGNESSVTFIGTMFFNESFGSAVDGYSCNISFIGTTYFHGNSASYAGGIMSSNSNIMFSGVVYFERNVANYSGGAIALTASKLIFKPNLDIFFTSNHAKENGGALHITDSQCSLGSSVPFECFITIDGPSTSISNISLYFENNSADITGSILYGGQIDQCRLYFRSTTTNLCGYQALEYSDFPNSFFTLIEMFNNTLNGDNVPNISSKASIIADCEESGSDEVPLLQLNPGQQFIITLIGIGQTRLPVPTIVFWEKIYPRGEYRLSPLSHTINDSCTDVSFFLYLPELNYRNLQFKLYPDNPCQNLIKGLTLRIHVLPCPVGFDLSQIDSKCVCAMMLKKLGIQNCYIDGKSGTIERMKNNFWIYEQSNETLILHEFPCPLDYCTSNPLNVTLSDPSVTVQCDFNRNGIVCGQCQKNFSLALGSLHCITCDNIHITLIVLFALTGIALVALIFLLQLTVSVGTLNGLFFYANIIQANRQSFFPRAIMNIFTTLISWLNLDLGIETCFYDGMDIYAYSWFQFLFPFYVWLLVGCIILACRYSRSFAKQLGQNPVAVLATLLLMSYSKILDAVIVPLTLTSLTYYTAMNETRSVVWLYDASIQYFIEPKHTTLGVFAVLCIAVFVLPYISLLFFGHWLQGCSNWWILSWLNKIKPFMDAYHAPYRKHTRYWTGLLLLSRLGLFLTFAINANGSEGVNLLAISSVSLALLAIKRRVYENRWKDLLESSYILNLGIFSVATFYLNEESQDDKNQLILSNISVGIALITFLGILIFHINLVFKSSNIWKEHMVPFIQRSQFLSKILGVTVIKDDTAVRNIEASVLHALPTTTEVAIDLNKPLLLEISTDAATYN